MKKLARSVTVALVAGAVLLPVAASAIGNRIRWRADYYDADGNRIGAEGKECHGSYYSWGDTSGSNMTYEESICGRELEPM